MAIRVDNTTEATLFPKKGRLLAITATYQVTLSDLDLRALKDLGRGSVQNALEEAIEQYLHSGGSPMVLE